MSRNLSAYDIFTPNQYPTYTYVERPTHEYEKTLLKYLRIGGTTVAISGPSKSGKTILARRVVGDSNLILVSASGVSSGEELWERVLDKIRTPHQSTIGSKNLSETRIGGGMTATGLLFGTANTVAKISVQYRKRTEESSGSAFNRRGVAQVVELLANQDVAVLIDDFHFMDRSLQNDIAKAIKGASHEGVRFILTVASHRSDDLERATNQLTGRVANLEIEPWKHEELMEIAKIGFPLLNAANDILVPHRLVSEAGGSPQLMQLICLNAAIEMGFEYYQESPTPLSISDNDVSGIMEESTKLTQQKTTAEILLHGPKSRGTERDVFKLDDESTGDVYYCILRALANGGGKLSYTYEEIKARVENMTSGHSPQGASITNALSQMSSRTTDRNTGERIVDWDEEKRTFTIVDPYILFYLKWSDFLNTHT